MANQNQAQAQAQPIDPGVQAIQNLRLEVADIGQALAAQRISGSVIKVVGNQKQYREWIRSIEKVERSRLRHWIFKSVARKPKMAEIGGGDPPHKSKWIKLESREVIDEERKHELKRANMLY